MPSFETCILGSPLGFIRGCGLLNGIAASDNEACSVLIQGTLKSFKENVIGSIQSEEINALIHILRSREQAQPKPNNLEVASVLDTNTILSRECITVLVAGLDGINSSSPSASAVVGVDSEKPLVNKVRRIQSRTILMNDIKSTCLYVLTGI
jgi:hypothetical protein